jgi:hypothetical protein
LIIGVSHANQLGNALFNHAHLMAAAWEHDMSYVNPCFGRHADLFPRLRNDPFCAGLPGVLPDAMAAKVRGILARGAVRAGKVQARREATGRSLPFTSMLTSGWTSSLETEGGVVLVDREPFRSRAARSRVLLVSGPLFRFEDRDRFLVWRTRIADHFRQADEVVQRAAALAATARHGRAVLLGFHVRRRDYAEFIGGKYFYEWAAYEHLMREISRSWGPDQVAFLVTGDEPVPPGFAAGLPWTAGPGDVGTDLASLGACDMVVGPPSTFSHWAAFTAGIPYFWIEDPNHVPDRTEFAQSRG